MEISCSVRSRAHENSFPVKLLLAFPATLPYPFRICLDAALPRLRGWARSNMCFDWFAAYVCHWWPDASWKGREAELYLLFLDWGAFISVLLLYLPFPKLWRTWWLWDLNLWMRLKLALLGVRQRGKIWWDCLSFGNPDYSMIKFVLASIYVSYETSQCRIGFLIIIVIWQKC